MAYHQRNIAKTAAEPIAILTLPPSVNPWQSQSTQGAATLGLVLPVTANDFALIDQCRKEVCGTLWGSGNPDISGSGVRQYCYFTETLLNVPLDDCRLHH